MNVGDMRRKEQRARVGLESLEARNLQSALVGVVDTHAEVVRPPSSNASAYVTTVTSESDGAWFGKKVKID